MKTVVIVGGGTAGWMAAAALAKTLGPKSSARRVEIRLIESDEIGTVGVGEATIPQIRLFNNLLGLDENEFVRETQGTFKLGIEFVGWGGEGERYIHAFGEVGLPLGLTPFHHYWLRARQGGAAHDYWDFSANAQAAYAGKFARVKPGQPGPMAEFPYAFHFDAGLYAAYLRRFAEGLGVVRSEGKIVDVARAPADGFVTSVTTDKGEVIAGELFVDCSGFRGLLIEQTLNTGYDDWSEFLPCDRAIAVPTASVEAPVPYTRATARPAGWQWRIPLQHRVGNGYVHCSRFVSEADAMDTLLSNLDGEVLAEPRALRFVTGRRKKQWNANVVALGLASGFLEPLESTSIHLIQSGIAKLIQLFPFDGIRPVEVEEFNAQAEREFVRVRDFIILHYKATNRPGDFWRHCREMAVPDSLTHKIELFRTSGRLFRDWEDLFAETSWLQVLIGQNVIPQDRHPLADGLSDDQLAAFLTDVKTIAANRVATMPTHARFIADHCKAAEVALRPLARTA